MLKPFDSPIYVTRPFLPPLEDYKKGLEEIWASAWLTNNGPVLQRYQKALCRHFDTENLCLFNNGTLALQIALQGMQVTGEVITTPFTFVATTHALFWNKVRPVFVDIEPDYYTMDPARVEEAITPWTTAILAVHVYGHPCRHEALADIARRHRLRLIYDAAHAFNVKVDGCPIGQLGDLSMFSFHSTKLYHSVEGGMLVFADGGLKKTFDYLKNFGFENEEEVVMPGTNAKMNEFQALMGLLMLDHLPALIERRRKISQLYRQRLARVPGIVVPPPTPSGVDYNFAYFPIEIDEKEFGLNRDALYSRLKDFNVYTRRYFYPLLCDFAVYRHVHVRDPLTVARRVASRILSLPLFDSLPLEDVERICDLIEHLCPGMAKSTTGVAEESSCTMSVVQPRRDEALTASKFVRLESDGYLIHLGRKTTGIAENSIDGAAHISASVRKKRLIIISAGKFGREAFAWATQAIANGENLEIKGFLDNRPNALAGYNYEATIIGSVENYVIEEDDVFIGAIGDPRDKVKYYTPILKRGGTFINLIHPLANLGQNVQLGKGILLGPFASVTCDARIGDHVSIGSFSNVAHDTVLGNWSQISNHCGINGNASIGDGVFMGSHACVIPGINVGDWAFLGAGSVVIRDIQPGVKVVGNPAAMIGRAAATKPNHDSSASEKT